jgi:hypothetical protein
MASKGKFQRKSIKRLRGGAAVLLLGALALTACSSAAKHSSSASTTNNARPSTSANTSTNAGAPNGTKGGEAGGTGAGAAVGTGAGAANRPVGTASPPPGGSVRPPVTSLGEPVSPTRVAHPCALVSQSQAQSILGISLQAPTEAPLGPTCIFKSTKGTIAATLAIEAESLDQIRGQMHDAQVSSLQGHQAVCGTYGRPTLYASLKGGSLLVVSAPCPMAQRLAADALPHIPA